MNNLNDGTDGRLPPGRFRLIALRILLLALGAVFTTVLCRDGAVPPEQYLIFMRLFLFNDYVGSLAMLIGFALMLWLKPAKDTVTRIAAWTGANPGFACGIGFITFALGARFVYMAHPLSMDEYAPVMQASAFAHRELAAHYPAPLLDRIVWAPFRGTFLLTDPATGTTMSGYWPGLALLLTPFVFLHVGWMLNPALAALALALIGDLAARTTADPEQARQRRGWAMLASLASPAFTINAMSYYAMPGLLTLNLLYLWLVLKPGHRHAFMAGLVGGLALVLHNPVPHVLMALPCLFWLAANPAGRRRLPALIAGYLPLGLLIGLGWPMLTSGLHMSGPMTATAQEGFVAHWANLVGQIFRLPSPELIQARVFATWKMWIWASPGLLLAPFFISVRVPALQLLCAAFVLTYLFYFLVPFDQGHGWGYRYIHPVWGLLPVAGGIWFASPGSARALGAMTVAAGLLATPAFLWETHQTIAEFKALRITPPEEGHWVVFINREQLYTADLVQNPPGSERVLNLLSQGPEQDRRLMAKLAPSAEQVVLDARGSAWRLLAPVHSASGSAGTN